MEGERRSGQKDQNMEQAKCMRGGIHQKGCGRGVNSVTREVSKNVSISGIGRK